MLKGAFFPLKRLKAFVSANWLPTVKTRKTNNGLSKPAIQLGFLHLSADFRV